MEFEFNTFESKAEAYVMVEAPMKGENDSDNYSETMKAFYCSQPGCKKSFRYQSEILRHMVTHNNKRPYVCTFKNCMKGFKRSDALATHMRIHTREKTFECPYGSCKSTFSTKAGLKYHTLKHKSEKQTTVSNRSSNATIASMDVEDNKQNMMMELGAEAMLDLPLGDITFQKQYSLIDFSYENPAFNSDQFDNTFVQQISPLSVGEKAIYTENADYDTYLTNYSTSPIQSYSNGNKDAENCLNYHITNNTENDNSFLMTNTSNTKSDGKLLDLIQKMVEENSNLKKRLDYFQCVMGGNQYQGEVQGNVF